MKKIILFFLFIASLSSTAAYCAEEREHPSIFTTICGEPMKRKVRAQTSLNNESFVWDVVDSDLKFLTAPKWESERAVWALYQKQLERDEETHDVYSVQKAATLVMNGHRLTGKKGIFYDVSFQAIFADFLFSSEGTITFISPNLTFRNVLVSGIPGQTKIIMAPPPESSSPIERITFFPKEPLVLMQGSFNFLRPSVDDFGVSYSDFHIDFRKSAPPFMLTEHIPSQATAAEDEAEIEEVLPAPLFLAQHAEDVSSAVPNASEENQLVVHKPRNLEADVEQLTIMLNCQRIESAQRITSLEKELNDHKGRIEDLEREAFSTNLRVNRLAYMLETLMKERNAPRTRSSEPRSQIPSGHASVLNSDDERAFEAFNFPNPPAFQRDPFSAARCALSSQVEEMKQRFAAVAAAGARSSLVGKTLNLRKVSDDLEKQGSD